MVFGVNIVDLDVWFLIDPVEQPIKSNSVGSGNMSHCGTSSFDYHFDDNFIVFKDVQLRLTLTRMCVNGYKIHILGLGFGMEIRTSFPDASMVGLDIVVG